MDFLKIAGLFCYWKKSLPQPADGLRLFDQDKNIQEVFCLFSQAPVEILSVIIMVHHLPPRIVIMTTITATVPSILKAPGGTIAVTNLL